ncbi:MAG: hypothetical protein KAH72_02965 [Flavobacteriaceae bacterium]|nr:hypothetical protein [Flavobacteriaceae bacterium]
MKKILLALILIFLSKDYSAFSQTIKTDININDFKNIIQEKIFVHQNSSFLLSGEYLFYKVYCLNTDNDNLSNFSKIAYVELIRNDKLLVFKHKIILKNGMGQGDFFIPTSVASGNYKLIAYTQWMRNGDISNFYQNDISIINPFQENQKEILVSDEYLNIEKTNSEINLTNNSKSNISKNKIIDLKTNSKTFSNRERVTLNINSLKNNLSNGNYSISVRKIDNLQIPNRHTSITYQNIDLQKTGSTSLTNKSITYLPELRGELISGKVLSKENHKPIHNAKVALSIPGENYIFKIANTNQEGIFYFNIDNEYDNKNANIQILHNEPDKFILVINQLPTIDYNALEFYNFKITPESEQLVLKHSINNQIENAYSSEKPDSIKSVPQLTPFYNNKAKNYFLDDYTRFKTLRETFIEIIPEVYTRQKKENYTFHVRVYDLEIETGLLPLVIIDGSLIQNQNELQDFNTNKIKSISIVNKMYVYGSQVFEGIISINTFDGDYISTLFGDYVKNIELLKPLSNKIYFNQVYDQNNNLNRIPDFRRQLLWKPSFKFYDNNETITFYTSDVKGEFEICLEGFNIEGKPVSLKSIITVK